jgi:hypothetical protein
MVSKAIATIVAQRPIVSARWETRGAASAAVSAVSWVAIPPVHHFKPTQGQFGV